MVKVMQRGGDDSGFDGGIMLQRKPGTINVMEVMVVLEEERKEEGIGCG